MNQLYIIIFSFLTIIFSTFSWSSQQDLKPTFCSVSSLSSEQTVESLMFLTLQILEKKSTIQTKIIEGGGAADTIILSKNYAARSSSFRTHRAEAQNFCQIQEYFTQNSEHSKNIGFKLCLPLSIKLIKNELRIPGKETTGSLIFMPLAKGHPVYSYFEDYSCFSILRLQLIFSRLGKSLAIFQNAFRTTSFQTAGHLDFHGNNIFCQLKLKKYPPFIDYSFSLIDCGTMQLTGIHALTDPTYYTYNAAYLLEKNGYPLLKIKHLLKKFYTGYLNKLPSTVRQHLKELFLEARNISSREMYHYGHISFMPYESPKIRDFAKRYDVIHQTIIDNIYKDL